MVEFYLNTYDFDVDAYTLIYYTGKQKLAVTRRLPPMVLVMTVRPDLRSIVCEIIMSIESGDCLPEDLVMEAEVVEQEMNDFGDMLEQKHIGNQREPFVIFERLLLRCLKHYQEKQVLELFANTADSEGRILESLDKSELQDLFAKVVREAHFGADTMNAFMQAWDDGTGMETVSRAKVIEHCQKVFSEFHTSGSANGVDQVLLDNEEVKNQADISMGHRLSDIDARERLNKKEGDRDLKRFIANLDQEHADARLARWAVLYCGGSKPVSQALTKVCSDFDIKYDQEKFDW